MPTMKGTVQEDDYRTEVRIKDKNLLKLKFYLLRFTKHPDLQTAAPELGSGPKSGSGAKWMASVRGRLRGSSLDPARTALPLIRTGTQHTLGPVRISCLGQKDGKENGQFTMIERKRQPHQRTHLSQRKKVRIAFAFAFAFALHLSFFNGQRHQN
jgi:hypothetical protein